MAWRLYVGDRPIRRVDILPGKPSVVAAWTQADHVMFLDLQTGAKRGEQTFDLSQPSLDTRTTPEWAAFTASLTAPNASFLPYVRVRSTPPFAIYSSTDGSLRLYRTGAVSLALEVGGKETTLPVDAKTPPFVAVDLDRAFGLVAALDENARLHLFQQHTPVGVYEMPLKLEPELRPDLVVTHGGTLIFVTDGRQIVVVSPTGQIRRRMECHYTLGTMRPSPDGHLFVVSDMDAAVLRIYDTETFELTHQRFAVDLIADAKRIQLIPGPATPSGAVGPLALTNKGILGFALAGTVCVTTLARFKPLPGIAPITDEDTADAPAAKPETQAAPVKSPSAQTPPTPPVESKP